MAPRLQPGAETGLFAGGDEPVPRENGVGVDGSQFVLGAISDEDDPVVLLPPFLYDLTLAGGATLSR